MYYELIAKFLEAEGHAAEGSTLFVHEMDADEGEGVLVRGPLNGVSIDPNLPGYYRTNVQVIVRSPKQTEGEALITAISKSLTFFQKEFTGDNGEKMVVKQMSPNSLPIRYPRSDGAAIEWSVDFFTVYVVTA